MGLTDLLTSLREYWPVHLLLALYTGTLAYHAWIGNRKTRSLADYYVGGRVLGGVTIGLSFFATYSSTNSFVGFAGQAYIWGAPWLLLVPFVVGFTFLSWTLIANRLRHCAKRLGSLTIPDFIGFRFGSPAARVSASCIVLVASFFYMTAVYKGIGNLLVEFLDLPYGLAIVMVFVIVVIYTAVGGFISVVKTDSVQGVVMIAASVLLFWGTVRAAGGLGSLQSLRVQPGTEHLFTWNAGTAFPLLLGVLFAGTVKAVVEPRQLSRFYALKSRAAVRTGIWVSGLSFLLVYSMLVPIGLYARQIVPDGISDSDLVVPRLLSMEGVFSGGASAFLMLAMVSAAMSSLDSVLLVMASTTERDIVSLVWHPKSERAALRATRVWVGVFALITAVIALNPPGGIVELTAFSGSLYAACFLPAVVLGLYWRRGNRTAVLSSFGAGLLVLAVWRFLPFNQRVHYVFPAVVVSVTTYVFFSLVFRSHSGDEVEGLFSEPTS